jgi:hypothetical protein
MLPCHLTISSLAELLRNDVTGDHVMARGPATFKQADLKRALKGAVAAGVEIARIEIDARTGNIIMLTPQVPSAPVAPYELWKAGSNAR